MTEKEEIKARLQKRELERAYSRVLAQGSDIRIALATAGITGLPCNEDSAKRAEILAYIGALEDSVTALEMLRKL